MGNVNIAIDLVFIISILFILVRNRLLEQMDRKLKTLFRILAVSLLVILVSDAAALAVNGHLFPFSRVLNYFFDSVFYIAEAIFCLYWVALADYWSFRDHDRLERYMILRIAPMMIETVLILANPFLHWVFYVNEKNEYVRGEFYLVNLLVFYVYFVYAVFLVVCGILKNKELPERKRQNIRMLSYLILPLFGVIYITVSSGMSVLWPLVCISVFLASTDEQGQLLMAKSLKDMQVNEQLAVKENELTKKSVSLVIHQLQPNFLYNSLSVIQELCEKNPKKAKEALSFFHDYLKGNMSALSMQEEISFEKELSHIRSYLSLEQLRFHDKLRLTVDCPAKKFMVPPLSILIFVESAVRDGMTVNREGSLVSLVTEETEKAFRITVEDNGNGANPLSLLDENEESSLGIQTSIQRIEHACKGSVKVSAVFGEGMKIVISLPKQG